MAKLASAALVIAEHKAGYRPVVVGMGRHQETLRFDSGLYDLYANHLRSLQTQEEKEARREGRPVNITRCRPGNLVELHGVLLDIGVNITLKDLKAMAKQSRAIAKEAESTATGERTSFAVVATAA